jgi:hypothetical protein
MPTWSEDVATFSLEEILQQQVLNRVWSKELRGKSTSLVSSRLANKITYADYLAERKLAHEDADECRRRAYILEARIVLGTGRLSRLAPLQ